RREGNNLIIEYGDGDSVTVQNAYYYADGRACVEYIEFADGSKGTIDYENVKLDIVSAENENNEDSALLEPTTDVTEVEEVNVFDEYMGDNNEMSNELPEEADTTVDNCVEALEELYMSEQTSDETDNDETYYEEQENAIYDNSTDSMVDSIVNQLVQDMSENEVNTVSDSDVITGSSSSDDNVQLWAS
ncbi:MAG: hypothetical protein J1F42_13560, partial [Lachnospiraceae bacterium]|nr:hypothetical protein [Lachnospiraceae bacterium]